MKRVLSAFTFILSMLELNAQITYEHTYPGPNSPIQSQPIIINMGGADGYKYFYVDYSTNKLELFNLDHSSFKSVTVPVTLTSQAEYRIGYVTWELFDCDSSKFEYMIQSATWRNSIYIYREDGALLFKQDSTQAPWCVGCYGKAYDVVPIYNTPQGAKLMLAKADSIGLSKTYDIYSLCGTLPVNIKMSDVLNSFVTVFPNPSGDVVNFEVSSTGNLEKAELVILDMIGNEIKRQKISLDGDVYQLPVATLSKGVYSFALISNGGVIESGKFVISK